jgi:hypothetical protein
MYLKSIENQANDSLYLFIPMCYYKQYKIIPSNTSLLLSDLRSGYMFRYHVPSSDLNIKIT